MMMILNELMIGEKNIIYSHISKTVQVGPCSVWDQAVACG